jgi:hypothetical protein
MQALDSLDLIIRIDYQGFCKLASSTDGANTWDIIYDETWHKGDPPQNFPNPHDAFSMTYPYKDHIYLAFDMGQLRHSRNKGITFDTVFFSYKTPLSHLTMADTSSGIVYQEYNTKVDPDFYQKKLYITTDGWNTHSTVNIDTINGNIVNVSGIHFQSADTFSFISPRSDVAAMYYSTIDGGKTWNEFNLSNLIEGNKNCHLSKLFFLNDSLGWISAMESNNVGDQSKDVIFKTTNGGKTWKLNYRKENKPIFGLCDIAFHDVNNGIAVGPWGKILRTTDGGINWTQEYLKYKDTIIEPTCMNICYLGSQPIVGSGGPNIIWKREEQSSVVNQNQIDNFLNIYPNPIFKNQEFTIEFKTKEIQQNLIIKISDISGKELERQELMQNSNSIRLVYKLPNNFSSGTYLIYIESEGEIIATEKLIVE